jgi:hypothetical protein
MKHFTEQAVCQPNKGNTNSDGFIHELKFAGVVKITKKLQLQ